MSRPTSAVASTSMRSSTPAWPKAAAPRSRADDDVRRRGRAGSPPTRRRTGIAAEDLREPGTLAASISGRRVLRECAQLRELRRIPLERFEERKPLARHAREGIDAREPSPTPHLIAGDSQRVRALRTPCQRLFEERFDAAEKEPFFVLRQEDPAFDPAPSAGDGFARDDVVRREAVFRANPDRRPVHDRLRRRFEERGQRAMEVARRARVRRGEAHGFEMSPRPSEPQGVREQRGVVAHAQSREPMPREVSDRLEDLLQILVPRPTNHDAHITASFALAQEPLARPRGRACAHCGTLAPSWTREVLTPQRSPLQQHCEQCSESRPSTTCARHRPGGGATVVATRGVGCPIPYRRYG